MATDFFRQQDVARRKSFLLVIYFLLAIVVLIVLTYLLFAFVFLYLPTDDTQNTQQVAQQPKSLDTLWNWQLCVAVAIGVIAVVGFGSLFKIMSLAGGGKSVALMLGGREIHGTTRTPHERRLLNIVEEMALASGVPVPPVYVLPEEPGINAFAAGFAPGDAVVAVSAGSLNYLNRDELQGVVAHEFSHILNGDMRLNIRIMGLIFGILAVSVIGRIIMQVAASGSRRSSSNKKDGGGALILLGLGLFILGGAGAFFGRLIQAAVSRQREYLADASAVQFTRNPFGIAGALKKIGGLQQGSAIKKPQADEMSHMFFSDAFLNKRIAGMLATHPPLADRISRLDPQFDGNYPIVEPIELTQKDVVKEEKARTESLPIHIPGMPQVPFPVLIAAAEQALSHAGRITPEEIAYAQALHARIPEDLAEVAHEPFSARALVYCLLLDPDETIRNTQLALLEKQIDANIFAEVQQLMSKVLAMPEEIRLPVLDLSLPALRHMSPQQYAHFRERVQELTDADQKLSVFEYVLRCVLNHHLDVSYHKKRPRIRNRSLTKLTSQMITVLSMVAWEGHDNDQTAGKAFLAGMQAYLGNSDSSFALLPRGQVKLTDLDAALNAFAEATPKIKRQVMLGCCTCILSNEKVTVRESELLRAVGDTLDCPMPPLVPGEFKPEK